MAEGMNFHVLTLFPEMIMQGVTTSITGRAMEQGTISVEAVNIRDFTKNKHRKVDDYTYGGGAGMLMQAQPVYDAYASVAEKIPSDRKKRVIYVTPQGTPFCQAMAEDLAKNDELIFLCGHYEGIDERVLEEVVTDYVSIGDYVLTGGELAAMVMIDAISRLVPGVLNNEESAETESFHGNLLEYPQYSRPKVWHDKEVPEVLLSGNTKNIRKWRLEQSIARTKERRPDLYAKYEELQSCLEVLKKNKLNNIDMIELISRGRAILIGRRGDSILLEDANSGVLFHYADDPKSGEELLQLYGEQRTAAVQQYGSKSRKQEVYLILHQQEMVSFAKEILGVEEIMSCYQKVYTRKESLPITGLYRLDGQPAESGLFIRNLGQAEEKAVLSIYTGVDGASYVKKCLDHGNMYGAFFGDELAGIMGIHEDGSLGMLQVKPSFQGRKVAKALETYLINLVLSWGWIPYGQVEEDNEISWRLQESLGLYTSKDKIYWMR